jgi:hypothetical protein
MAPASIAAAFGVERVSSRIKRASGSAVVDGFGESLRGAAHRLDPPRVLGSRSRPRRTTPMPHPRPIPPLLSAGSYPSRARQGRTRRQTRRAPRARPDRAGFRSRRPASSLHPPGGVVTHRRPRYHEARIIGPALPARSRSSSLPTGKSALTVHGRRSSRRSEDAGRIISSRLAAWTSGPASERGGRGSGEGQVEPLVSLPVTMPNNRWSDQPRTTT